MEIKRRILMFFAFLVLIIGVIFTPTPLPGTTLMIIFSLTYLIKVSDTVTFYMKHVRKKFKIINNFFIYVENHTKEKTRKTLNETHPETIIIGESLMQFRERMQNARNK